MVMMFYLCSSKSSIWNLFFFFISINRACLQKNQAIKKNSQTCNHTSKMPLEWRRVMHFKHSANGLKQINLWKK